DTPPPPSEPAGALPPVRIVRQLDAVHIDYVTLEHKKNKAQDDAAVVVYQSNGRCTPYEVRVVDDFGSAMIITVDAVASPKVRREGE
ncbi:MAG: hypothetical protein WCI20_07375, partial [bacterium]